MTITYKPATAADLSKIVAIDVLSYENPIDEEILVRCIYDHQIFLALDGKRVIGFVCWEDRTSHNEIVALAVHPAYRRKGIGSKLLQFVLDLEDTVKVEVRETNLTAQLFLRANNLTCFDVVKNHYVEENKDEDCYVFTKYAGIEV